ncbi:MAG TPA: hypothetical protein VG895_02235 [Patescibacteria group bacterium]|nr:hypothetical protein [Patescibacteria group bacterium]
MYLTHSHQVLPSVGLSNNAAVGAAIGSFTAFIFGLIAYNYTKKREKWITHHNALVKTERLVNRHLNEITGNVFLLEGAIKTFEKDAFSENVLDPLESPDYMIDFHNLELVNTYQDYEALVDKVNHDLSAWNKSNERLFNVALSGKVPLADIDLNRKELTRRSREITSHLEDLLEESYTIGAYVRKFMAVDKPDFFGRLGPTERIKLTEQEISSERKKFVKESKDTIERDKNGRLSKYKH